MGEKTFRRYFGSGYETEKKTGKIKTFMSNVYPLYYYQSFIEERLLFADIERYRPDSIRIDTP